MNKKQEKIFEDINMKMKTILVTTKTDQNN